jgi:hypothetical protein
VVFVSESLPVTEKDTLRKVPKSEHQAAKPWTSRYWSAEESTPGPQISPMNQKGHFLKCLKLMDFRGRSVPKEQSGGK